MMRPVAILKLAPAVPIVAGAIEAGAATGAATTAATAGTGLGSALMQGAKKKIGQVGVKDAASIAQDATDKAAERAQQAQQNNIQSSQDMADKAKAKADLTKGQYYPPSIGGYLEQRYTGGTQDGVETNKKIKPGGEVTRNPGGEVPPPGSNATYLSPEWQTNIERLSNQQQYGYDIPQKQLPVAVQPTEAPVESFTGELPDSTWSSYDNHGLQQLKDRERIYENEHQEVMNRITESLREYLNPDGTYKKGVPTQFAIRTHILDEQRKGVGLDKRGNEKSNGDSIVAIINPHLDDPTKPALRTVMLRNSEFSTDTTPQPFSPSSAERETGLKNVQKVIHADGMSKRERDVRFKAAKKIRRDNGIRELNTNIVQTGEPMDIAMRLLKMPLVPNSIKQIATYNDGGPDPIDDYTAEYKHPETGEIYPMFGTVRPDLGRGGGSEVRIGGKGNAHDTGFNYDENRYANEMYRDDGHWDGKTITPRYASLREASPLSADVHTAMNDLAASMYDKYGVKVIPPTYGESMMETGYKPKSDLEEEIWADKEHWPVPVQTGEPMEIAMQMLKGSVHLTHNEDLPHQFAQDIANLDHKHEITPTDSGSTINNIHPDMLRTIELMAQNYQENTPVQEEVYEPPTYF